MPEALRPIVHTNAHPSGGTHNVTVRARSLFVVALTAATAFGVPGQARAAWVPRALGGTLKVVPAVPAGATFARTLDLPWRANAVGVSFADKDARGARFALRAHTATGWSAWEAIDPADNLPDAGREKHASKRTVTDPVWIGSADAIGVTVTAGRAPVHDVRVDVVNTLGDARPATLLTKAGRALRSFFTMQPAVPAANAMTSTPRIIRRAQWGANESWRRANPEYVSTIKMVFIHHTDSGNSYSRSQSAAVVRSIYHYHVFSRGWNDIGYNFLVDRYGQIFEGRYGGIDKAVIGAHTLGFNTYSTGISLIGNYASTAPTYAMLKSLAYVTAWKMDVHHIPPTGTVAMTSNGNPKYARGRVVAMNRISGHRNAYPTACPGNAAYAKLPWLRSAVANLGNPKIYLPSWSTSVVRPDGDGANEASRFIAGLSARAAWTLTLRDAAGVAQRTFSGTGTAISAVWDGTSAAGTLLPTGRYAWTIEAKDSAGHAARPAGGSLLLVATHPDGTLLSDSKGKYVLSQGSAQSITDLIAAANFGEVPPVVRTGDGERTRYAPAVTAASLRAGTLLKNTTVSPAEFYVWDGSQLRKFGTTTDPNGNPVDVFTALGYDPKDAISVSDTTIKTLVPSGPDVTATDSHPAGSLVQKRDGSLYVVLSGGGLQPISTLAKRSLYRATESVGATAVEEAVQPAPGLASVAVRDGTLVAGPDGARWILVPSATQAQKRKFADASLYAAMGYATAWLLPATQAELDAYSSGPPIG
jgi:hypothetical protein